MKRTYTKRELAEAMQVFESDVDSWIKNLYINPSKSENDDIVFQLNEVTRFKEWYRDKVPLREAAHMLNVSISHLNNEARTGNINSELVDYGKQKRRMFRIDELNHYKKNAQRIKRKKEQGKSVEVYANGLILFDEICTDYGNAFVIQVEPVELWINGEHHIPEKLVIKENVKRPKEVKYNKDPGVILFKCCSLDENFLFFMKSINTLIRELGVNNVKVYKFNTVYKVRARSGLVKGTKTDFEILRLFLISGDVVFNGKIVLRTKYQKMNVNLSSKCIDLILEFAKKNQIDSFDEAINQAIEEYIN